MSIPAYPNFILDTSRCALAPVHTSQVPWVSITLADENGFVWVNAFQTNSILVRARSRLNGSVLTEFAVVKDAHKHSNQSAMEKVEEVLAERVAAYRGERGEATFYDP